MFTPGALPKLIRDVPMFHLALSLLSEREKHERTEREKKKEEERRMKKRTKE